MNVPIWIIISFQQRDSQESQNLNIDAFCRLPVTSAQYFIGTERNPDAAILKNYDDDDDDYSQGYAQIQKSFWSFNKS